VLLDLVDCHVVTAEPEEGARIAMQALDAADSAWWLRFCGLVLVGQSADQSLDPGGSSCDQSP
jgi:hypothetical protein